MGSGAESSKRPFSYAAVSLVLVAHYDESGILIQIACQLLAQLLLQILFALKDNEAGADLTPFRNKEREQLFQQRLCRLLFKEED